MFERRGGWHIAGRAEFSSTPAEFGDGGPASAVSTDERYSFRVPHRCGSRDIRGSSSGCGSEHTVGGRPSVMDLASCHGLTNSSASAGITSANVSDSRWAAAAACTPPLPPLSAAPACFPKAAFPQRVCRGVFRCVRAYKPTLSAAVVGGGAEGGGRASWHDVKHAIGVYLHRLRRYVFRRVRWLSLLVVLGVLLWCGVRAWMAPAPLPPWESPLAVVVHHKDVVQRMQLDVPRRLRADEVPSWTLRVLPRGCPNCIEGPAWETAVQRAAAGLMAHRAQEDIQHQQHHLNVDVRGADALMESTAEDMINDSGPYAVFATPAAPLGRIGPFLLAMHSVTDDVDIAGELPRWAWMRRTGTHHGRRWNPRAASTSAAAADTGPHVRHQRLSAPPYTAVMGIPSVDDARHATLRATQRETWLGYSRVARHDNDFDGALLQLYIFAAREPSSSAGEEDRSRVPQDEDIGLTVDAEAFLPTTREFRDGSAFYEAWERYNPHYRPEDPAFVTSSAGAAAGQQRTPHVHSNMSYVQRRMSLRPDWRKGAGWTSPCSHVMTSTVYDQAGVSPAPAMTRLRAFLDLPTSPAFTSGARYLCTASAALWREALSFRNMLWVDMMTDRQPTSKKKHGEDGGWGLAVEVGMTQKTILWLEYAYHAFPDVPYIIKSDDDVYVKVPQLVSDMWYIYGDRQTRDAVATTTTITTTTTAVDTVDAAAASGDDGRASAADDALYQARTTPVSAAAEAAAADYQRATASSACVYWGLLWGQYDHVPYFVGMLYLLDRRLARVILEPAAEKPSSAAAAASVDFLRLAMLDYNPRLHHYYRDAGMYAEDFFIGKTLKARQRRAQELCPDRRVTFIEEGSPRFHDLRRGYRSMITWASVVLHRCLPADMRFIDYYFHHEHLFSANISQPATMDGGVEEAAKAVEAAAQAQARLEHPATDGYQFPLAQWAPHGTVERNRKKLVVREEDGVAVYDVTFRRWGFEHLVRGGIHSVPHYKKNTKKYVLVE
ncbi:phosphoglycan beta 13 galactosyltransferase [Leptomonas pyrrhocoris]|uniref:Phosphoglycan beta 13 galactosyltransferase n=1 Tax=Leptomonas pyrrhocoris TaxID=157538 RepID=A0A0N1J4B2_LEPPY|nr:phosphoglycan beta 13 galactosyltransferase [Leptomonas pyrrhocoris]KPA74882.1 phosphoglycan beta 13 galactosyltransferase [Leptomonas pyrrhocoris]|eukprot:XP_015653321.1 phosphoglycan beta 13 galactosyltransferase [Leptomonas pyrrhocoris]